MALGPKSCHGPWVSLTGGVWPFGQKVEAGPLLARAMKSCWGNIPMNRWFLKSVVMCNDEHIYKLGYYGSSKEHLWTHLGSGLGRVWFVGRLGSQTGVHGKDNALAGSLKMRWSQMNTKTNSRVFMGSKRMKRVWTSEWAERTWGWEQKPCGLYYWST